jgi:hypothetical protein
MNNEQSKQTNLVETTDCLEAIGVCRGWKNFLFIVVAICLLLLQASFWLVDTGWVKAASKIEPTVRTPSEIIPQETNETVIPLEGSETKAPAAQKNEFEEAAKQVTTEQAGLSEQKSATSGRAGSFFGIEMKHLAWVIRFCNSVLILAAGLYCLTTLFSLKISMVGRLGGINHVCRAFFLSLVMLVLLVPWQTLFGQSVIGATYTAEELVRWCSTKTGGVFGTIIHYLRFSGYWLLVVLLLVFSQLRGSRWTKAILRRLEVF